MKIYLAGIPGGGWIKREREIIERFPKRLWSYFWLTGAEGKDVELIYLAGNTILVEREREEFCQSSRIG